MAGDGRVGELPIEVKCRKFKNRLPNSTFVVCEFKSPYLPTLPGTYALVLSAGISSSVEIGKLGTLALMPGIYLYIGSAFGPGGLRARVAHHRKIATRPHWHIDYLRPKTSLENAWYSCDADKREHLWAEVVGEMHGATVLLRRFGASDCSCVAHLFYFAKMFREACFKELLLKRCPDHGPIRKAVGGSLADSLR